MVNTAVAITETQVTRSRDLCNRTLEVSRKLIDQLGSEVNQLVSGNTVLNLNDQSARNQFFSLYKLGYYFEKLNREVNGPPESHYSKVWNTFDQFVSAVEAVQKNSPGKLNLGRTNSPIASELEQSIMDLRETHKSFLDSYDRHNRNNLPEFQLAEQRAYQLIAFIEDKREFNRSLVKAISAGSVRIECQAGEAGKQEFLQQLVQLTEHGDRVNDFRFSHGARNLSGRYMEIHDLPEGLDCYSESVATESLVPKSATIMAGIRDIEAEKDGQTPFETTIRAQSIVETGQDNHYDSVIENVTTLRLLLQKVKPIVLGELCKRAANGDQKVFNVVFDSIPEVKVEVERIAQELSASTAQSPDLANVSGPAVPVADLPELEKFRGEDELIWTAHNIVLAFGPEGTHVQAFNLICTKLDEGIANATSRDSQAFLTELKRQSGQLRKALDVLNDPTMFDQDLSGLNKQQVKGFQRLLDNWLDGVELAIGSKQEVLKIVQSLRNLSSMSSFNEPNASSEHTPSVFIDKLDSFESRLDRIGYGIQQGYENLREFGLGILGSSRDLGSSIVSGVGGFLSGLTSFPSTILGRMRALIPERRPLATPQPAPADTSPDAESTEVPQRPARLLTLLDSIGPKLDWLGAGIQSSYKRIEQTVLGGLTATLSSIYNLGVAAQSKFRSWKESGRTAGRPTSTTLAVEGLENRQLLSATNDFAPLVDLTDPPALVAQSASDQVAVQVSVLGTPANSDQVEQVIERKIRKHVHSITKQLEAEPVKYKNFVGLFELATKLKAKLNAADANSTLLPTDEYQVTVKRLAEINRELDKQINQVRERFADETFSLPDKQTNPTERAEFIRENPMLFIAAVSNQKPNVVADNELYSSEQLLKNLADRHKLNLESGWNAEGSKKSYMVGDERGLLYREDGQLTLQRGNDTLRFDYKPGGRMQVWRNNSGEWVKLGNLSMQKAEKLANRFLEGRDLGIKGTVSVNNYRVPNV